MPHRENGKVMFKRRMLKLTIAIIAALSAAGGLGVLTVGTALATTQAPAYAAVPMAASAPMNNTSNRCLNSTHTIACWAVTSSATTLYTSHGNVHLGVNDLVLIGCYYEVGSTVYDHVTQENGGNLNDTGHINDAAVDLNNHNPWNLPTRPNIPLCG